MPPETAVVGCYEAGRDGFWLHRQLAVGIANRVVDAASIEVSRTCAASEPIGWMRGRALAS